MFQMVLRMDCHLTKKETYKMADKRMFSRKLISSDVFLDMPLTAQGLFFHLCMRADDDGFVDAPNRIVREWWIG